MSNIIAIHQPAYLPWLGYFHKILLADVFVYLDIAQFEKNSFINRNKIKMPTGEAWLTVPVKLKDHFNRTIAQTKIADQAWRKKHWLSIEYNYKQSKFWPAYSQQLKALYEKEYANISELCFDQLLMLLEILEIKTKVIKASENGNYTGQKDELILDICKQNQASHYVSGALGRDYLKIEKFKEQGIKVYFQDYQHPRYEQLWGNFLPFMGIIDLLFNQGPKSKEIILKNNISKEDLLTKNELYE